MPPGLVWSACGLENTTHREGRSGYALSCCSPDANIGYGVLVPADCLRWALDSSMLLLLSAWFCCLREYNVWVHG